MHTPCVELLGVLPLGKVAAGTVKELLQRLGALWIFSCRLLDNAAELCVARKVAAVKLDASAWKEGNRLKEYQREQRLCRGMCERQDWQRDMDARSKDRVR